MGLMSEYPGGELSPGDETGIGDLRKRDSPTKVGNLATSLEISIDPTAQAPAVARAVVAAAYTDALPAVTLQDLKVIVTELVTNSWRHGPSEGLIRLSVEPGNNGCIRGRVEDEGHKAFGMREITDEGGLGLHIVDALAQDWEIAESGGTVRFSLVDRLH
jgi:two-component sensor histidine kinase